MLGAVNVAVEVLLYGTIGVLAGSLSRRFGADPRAGRRLHYVASAMYVLLSVAILIEVLIR